MAELEIPERAVDAALAVNVAGLKSDSAQLFRLEAAAPIIVANELRRLFVQFSTENRRPMDARELVAYAATMLLSRADELDPEGDPDAC